MMHYESFHPQLLGFQKKLFSPQIPGQKILFHQPFFVISLKKRRGFFPFKKLEIPGF